MVPSVRLTPISKQVSAHGFELVHGDAGSNYAAIGLAFHGLGSFSRRAAGGAVVLDGLRLPGGRSLWG